MILLLLLLSLLFGAFPEECQGLQVGFQYQYQYTGTVATFIPNHPKQYSGAGLRADVTLQVKSNGDVLVKISHIETGERNGKATCEVTEGTEFTYHPVESEVLGAEEAALLEIPFLVHINRTAVSYTEVPQEPVWVTNIRRGIINSIPFIPLTDQHPPSLTFGLKEDTIIGNCLNRYSLLKLTDYQAKFKNKKQEEIIEVDAQRESSASYSAPKGKGRGPSGGAKGRKTKTHQAPAAEYRVPTIQDTLSILTRTLDTDQCKDNLVTMKINANQEAVEKTRRTSAGTYLLRGEGSALRLERGEVVGNIFIYTGDSREFISTTTKQILQLRAVTQVEETFPITYQPERRSVSFSVADGPRSTIREKLTGIAPTERQINVNMPGIVDDISALMNNTGGTKQPHFLQTFQRLVERLSFISWPEVEELINRVDNTEREKQLILQAFVASGRDEVLSGLLEKMKDLSFRFTYKWLALQILQSPTTPVANPALLPAMLDVVTNMKSFEELSRAASLLNIARLANQYCLNPQTANTCDSGCDTDFIFNTLLPVLVRDLQDPLKWKRLVNVQAVCSLGSPSAIAFLQPIIDGTNEEDVDVRNGAIFCLTSDLLPKTARGMVFDTLLPLINNPTEFPEVRSVAILILSTWQPSLSWWEHIAISTWTERSPQVVSIISSLILSLNEVNDPRSENAKKVVHLAKHPRRSERVSLAKSTYFYLDEVLKNCQSERSVKMAWLSSTKSFFPRSVYGHLHFLNVMGMTRKFKGTFVSNVGSFLQAIHRSLLHPSTRGDESATFREIYEELKDQLELPRTADIDDEDSFAYLFISDPVPFIFAWFTDDKFNIQENMLALVVNEALQKVPVHFRLEDSGLVVTTDVGVPVVVKHEEDFAFTLSVDANSPQMNNVTVSLQVGHHNTLKANVFIPWWNGSRGGVGVEASLEFNLPKTMISWQTIDTKRIITLELMAEEQVKLMSRSNVMYTSGTSLYLVEDSPLPAGEYDGSSPAVPGKRVIPSREMHEWTNRWFLGLNEEWKGDFKAYKGDNFQNISVTQLRYNNFDYRVLLDPKIFPNRVSFTFSFDVQEREEGFSEQIRHDGQQTQEAGDYEAFSQMSQGADDYEMFSQVSQSSSAGFEEFEQISNGGGQEQQEQNDNIFALHLEKTQAMMMPRTPGGKVYTFAVSIEPQRLPVKLDIAFNLAASKGDVGGVPTEVHKIHTVVHIVKGSASSHSSELLCMDLRVETPFLLPLVTKEILQETNLATTFLLTGSSNNNCEGEPEVKLGGTLDVSPAALQSMRPNGEGDTCDGDSPTQIYPFYNQLSFKVTTERPVVKNFALRHVMDAGVSLSVTHNEGEPDNEVTVEAVWNTKNEEWNVTIAEPGNTIVFPMPDNILMGQIGGLDPFIDSGKMCHLTQQSVKTYDGLQHPFEPSSCWTTATIVPSARGPTREADIAVQVRFTDQWEVRLTSPLAAIVLDVTRSDLLVNEEPFSGHSEKFVAHRWRNSHTVEIGMVGVRVGDTVDIFLPNRYYGGVMGVCGNYDGEAVNDLMGPTGCLYTDPVLHTAAWNTPGVGCSRFSLRNEKRPLAEFRESCDKVVFQSTGFSQQNAMTNCTEWKYDERDDATGLHCKSKVPTPACRPGCHPTGLSVKHIGYNCLKPDGAGGVHYGENTQCFTTASPLPIHSGCFQRSNDASGQDNEESEPFIPTVHISDPFQ